MKKVENYTKFLLDNGLIFEINRKVLMPLGLALVVEVHPDNDRWIAIDRLLSVEDEDKDGFIFDKDTFEHGKRRYELYLLKEGQKKLDTRQDKLGYIVQENIEEDSDEIPGDI